MLAGHSGEQTDIIMAPRAPAASTCCPCAGTGWQRHNEPATALLHLYGPGVSKKLQKAVIFSNSVFKASHTVRMVRGSHSQSCWRVRRTERVKDRTFFNSKNN